MGRGEEVALLWRASVPKEQRVEEGLRLAVKIGWWVEREEEEEDDVDGGGLGSLVQGERTR